MTKTLLIKTDFLVVLKVLMIQACQNSGVGALGSSSADMPAVHTASNSTDDKHVVLIRDHTVLLLASKPGE